MSNKKEIELQELVKIFEKLGVQDPTGYANSQMNGDTDYLSCLVFLKHAWKDVADIHHKWMNKMRYPPHNETIQKCLNAVSKDELTMLVRFMQINLLGINLQLLEDNPIFDNIDINWQLFTVDEEGKPLRPIIGLIENYGDFDET